MHCLSHLSMVLIFFLKKKNEYFDAGGSHGLDESEQNIGKIKVKSSERQTRTSE